MERAIPKIGVPGILQEGETWSEAPKVMLKIDGGTGEVVEERTEDGSQQVIIKSFTASSEADEQAVLDETNFS